MERTAQYQSGLVYIGICVLTSTMQISRRAGDRKKRHSDTSYI